MRLAWVAVALLAALPALTCVQAQVPTPSLPPLPTPTPPANPAGGRLTIAAEETTFAVSVDRSGTANLTIRNAASSTPGLDDQLALDVVVTVTGAPDAWTATVSPATFRLVAGQSMHVTVKAAVQPQGAQDANLLVTARGTNPSTGSSVASTAIQASRSDGLTRNVLERIGPGVYVLIALVPLLILLIVVVVVRRRPAGIQLDAPIRTGSVAPGGRVAFQVMVANPGRRTEVVRLKVPDNAEGWTAVVPDPELEVPPHGVRQTELVLVAPTTATKGSRRAVDLTARAVDDPRRPARIQVEAIVEGRAK